MSDLFAVAFPIAVVAAGCWVLHRIKHSTRLADPPGRPFWPIADSADPGD